MKINWNWVALIGIILIMVFGTGCMTTEKATGYLKKKDKLDDVCAENFPVKDSLIKGDTVVVTDTLETFETIERIDTLSTKDTVYITKTLPGKIITRTIRNTDTIVRRDNARENVLQDQVTGCQDLNNDLVKDNAELRQQLSDMKAKRNKWRLWFWILVGAIGMLTFLKIKKILPF